MRTMNFKSSEAQPKISEGRVVRRCKGHTQFPKEDELGLRELLLGGRVEFSKGKEPHPTQRESRDTHVLVDTGSEVSAIAPFSFFPPTPYDRPE